MGKTYIAKRLRFGNGERTSVLLRPGGMPVAEVALYVSVRLRGAGKAAATIHNVVRALGLLYATLDRLGVDILQRVQAGEFLTVVEAHQVVEAARYRMDAGDHMEVWPASQRGPVVVLEKMRRGRRRAEELPSLDTGTISHRVRQFVRYLQFLVDYYEADLPDAAKAKLREQTARACKAMTASVPAQRGRNTEGARDGIDKEVQDRLVEAVHPDSSLNPWSSTFVRRRNWLVVAVLLCTGIRRGELCGLRIADLDKHRPQLLVARQADSELDPRTNQPNAKTRDRKVDITPGVAQALRQYMNVDRRALRAARKHPYIFVADDGSPLSLDSVNKLFVKMRSRVAGLPANLTPHVMRHTWNHRFSEMAEKMQLSPAEAAKARADQQGVSPKSNTEATYTRGVARRQARDVSLALQAELEEKLRG